MTREEQRAILQTIRQDKPDDFERAVGKRKNLCFGRFSLSAVCILYGADKITAAFGKAMRQDNPLVLDELPEIYNDFARIAGKALRLWAGYVWHEVHPLEMLAIVGDWRTLRREFGTYTLDEAAVARLLCAIKLRYGVAATIEGGRLVLPPKPISQAAKRTLATIGAALLVVLVAGIVALGLGVTYRNGIAVDSAQALLAAQSGKQYILTADVTLSAPAALADLRLNGNGHTITVEGSAAPLLADFGGEIYDCTVLLQTDGATIEDDYALLGHTNRGVWKNVRFVFAQTEGQLRLEGFETSADGNETCSLGGLFVRNEGTLSHCTIEGDLRWAGMATVNAELGVVASANAGTIEYCTLAGSLIADTIDVGGVAYHNETGAVIDHCTLSEDSEISQTTSAYRWSPNTGGIAAMNYGVISDCQVLGTVRALKEDVTLPEVGEDAPDPGTFSIYVGGVVAHNYALVRHCLVAGQVVASGDYTIAYAGGLAADNYYGDASETKAELAQNVVTANVYAYGAYAFLGGLAGASSGYMADNCFNGQFTYEPYRAMATYLGSVMGYGNFEPDAQADLFDNNHVVQLVFASTFGIRNAVPVVGYYAQSRDSLAELSGVTAHDSPVDFDELEVYWYGKQND